MENLNSVAFIAQINIIKPIEGADKIELAQVEGWTSIVQKGIHSVGDLVLCITTDAIIPKELATKWGVINYLRKGNRVRTVKLKGVYSECVLIPISNIGFRKGGYNIGDDLMEYLNIFKYEPLVITESLPGGKKVRFSQNPNFHIYHKFPNQKNTPDMFTENDLVNITRKIHGTNARYAIVKKSKITLLDRIKRIFNKYAYYEFVYGSHNVQKAPDSIGFYNSNVWHEILDKYDIENKLWKFFKSRLSLDNIIIYGEIYGPGIQGDKYTYNLNDKAFAGFDIEINGEYLNYYLKNYIFTDILNLPIVEELYVGFWSKERQDSYVNNQFIEGTNIPHEGIVVASYTGDRSKISKVINPDYHTYSEKYAIPDSH